MRSVKVHLPHLCQDLFENPKTVMYQNGQEAEFINASDLEIMILNMGGLMGPHAILCNSAELRYINAFSNVVSAASASSAA